MHTLNQQQFKKKLFQDLSTLIDVRTSEEQNTYGVISQKQVHIDISQENSQEKILSLPKDTSYLIYCWHGVRSKYVMEFMHKNGFTELYDLEGGIDKWEI